MTQIPRTWSRKQSHNEELRRRALANPQSLRAFDFEVRRAYITYHLIECKGNVARLAQLLMKNRTDLYKLLRKYDVDVLGIREALAPTRAARRRRVAMQSEAQIVLRRWLRMPSFEKQLRQARAG